MNRKIIISAVLAAITAGYAEAQTIKTEDLYIRDPFIVTDEAQGVYYLYRSATADVFDTNGDAIGGVEVFKSCDR